MNEVILAALGVVVVLLIVLLARGGRRSDGELRAEISAQLNLLGKTMMEAARGMGAGNAASVEVLTRAVERRLAEIQRSVDSKLDETLKSGLDSSFRRVSDQLTEVYKSMGEMRALTNGIGDLKQILSNVKTRGIWGEVQLSKLLADFMAPGQYVENAPVCGNVVEFAIRIPNAGGEGALLPVDAKFPMDRYARVLDLAEAGAGGELARAQKELAAALLAEAGKIGEKYIRPPITTDFGVMFLPSEGLYVEAVRLGVIDQAQSKYRVMVAGPSTLSALLTSFQAGFRAVAIEKHSAAILDMLNAVRAEFEGFAAAIARTQNSLQTAQGHLETVQRRSARIQGRLSGVEELE